MGSEFNYALVSDKLNAARSIAIVLAEAECNISSDFAEGVASSTLAVIVGLIEDAQKAIDGVFRPSL